MKRSLPLIAALLVGTALVSQAGQKWVYPVSVIRQADGSGSMGGSLGSTRNTSDTIARFGCYYEAFTTAYGGYRYASCYGTDGTQSLSCGTTDPALTDTIAQLKGDSYLWIQVDAAGNCTRVQIGAQSFLAPKAP